jgi:nuclear pore complex protein Nup98-Nup96
LELQLGATDIRLDEFGIPFAEINVKVSFNSFTELSWSQDPKDQHERSVWKLASVLWDPMPSVPVYGDSSSELDRYVQKKRRKELLSQLLEELVEKDADRHAQSASTIEEAAFAHLSAHRIEQACAVLFEGGDYRLATLLPMLGGDKSVRRRIGKQLEHWRNKGVLSEISIPVRSLYELIAGETCFSEGTKGPAEDAVPSFFIAQHFGLDWKRVLGLKLWYGCFEEEGITNLVQNYEDDFSRHPNRVFRPKPWYLNVHDNGEDVLDILWGLLRVYADEDLPLEEVLQPVSIGPNKIDYRLSWQLRTILAARGVRDFAGTKAEQTTTDFAGGLENAGLWEWALFVVMHIQDADARGAAIKNLIGRHVDVIEDGGKLDFLEKILRIPRSWIYEAKALQARHAGDHLQEAEYLISATAWTEAHKTILTQVAPEAIISGNLDKLRKILGKFGETVQPEGWGLGGHVYLDFIRLRELERTSSPKHHSERREVARRLLGTLKNMERKAFLQNIAVREMAGIVGSFVLKQDDMVGSISQSSIHRY